MIRRRPRAAAVQAHAGDEQIASEMSGVLLRGLRDALRNAPMKASARNRLMAMKLVHKLPDRFCGLTPRGLAVLRAAIAIEAASAGETPRDGSTEGKSAGPQDIAPNTAAQKDSPDV